MIDAREDFADGAWQLAQLSAPLSGPTGPPVLGGSGQGDALIAFGQGPADQQQVMARVAKAPPGGFVAIAPVGWVRGPAATITWEPPAEAFGATTYALVVDGQVRETRAQRHSRCGSTRAASATASTPCRCSPPTASASRR